MTPQNLGDETTRIVAEAAELVVERVFDAPRDLVWQAFTEPEHVPRWWGPHGSSTTVAEMDPRPGGRWRYIHHAAPGHDVSFKGEYLEVVPPEKVVRTLVYDVAEYEAQPAVETVALEDLGGSTKVTNRSRFPSPDVLEQALATGMTQGAIETYDRLAELLADLAAHRA
ncbi:MAG TPA: SRPBCC family protein [Micromonosporaceae bacterium]